MSLEQTFSGEPMAARPGSCYAVAMNTEPEKVALDPLAETILRLLEEQNGKSITPEQAARAYAGEKTKRGDPPDLWRRYLHAARQQALHLARAGRIAILRKGKPVDPTAPVKGVIRLAMPGDRPPAEPAPNG